MNQRFSAFRYFAPIMLLLALSCSSSRTTSHTLDSLVVEPGIYEDASAHMRLDVTVDANGLINYTFTDVALGKQVVKNTHAFSIYQRWAIKWEPEKKKLWAHSSDIGGVLWAANSKGEFVESDLISEYSFSDAPKDFLAILPSS